MNEKWYEEIYKDMCDVGKTTLHEYIIFLKVLGEEEKLKEIGKIFATEALKFSREHRELKLDKHLILIKKRLIEKYGDDLANYIFALMIDGIKTIISKPQKQAKLQK